MHRSIGLCYSTSKEAVPSSPVVGVCLLDLRHDVVQHRRILKRVIAVQVTLQECSPSDSKIVLSGSIAHDWQRFELLANPLLADISAVVLHTAVLVLRAYGMGLRA